MLYNSFHNKTFKTGLRKFQALKGKVIKVYRIFQLLKSVNYEEKMEKLMSSRKVDGKEINKTEIGRE
jgi:hypothetical protein